MPTSPLDGRLVAHVVGDADRVPWGGASALRALGLTVRIVPAVPADSLPADLEAVADVARFTALNGRPPLREEVGCAMAHAASCSALVRGEHDWALVLEDDAVVRDAAALVDRVGQVMSAWPGPEPLVYSFFTEGEIRASGLAQGPVPGSLALPFTLGMCVGYLVNGAAAALIADRQQPVSSVADWPVEPPEVTYCLDLTGLVGHPTRDEVPSTIVTTGPDPRVLSRAAKVQIWTGVWFLRHRGHFDGAADYRRRMLSRRAFFHRRIRL